MLKKFQTQDGEVTIEVTKEGKATYKVGNKKTTFDLGKCESFTYWFEATREKSVITEDMLTHSDEIEPWLWLLICEGEDRLEYNNDQREGRRHCSYSNFNDKINTLECEEDGLQWVLKWENKDMIWAAIDSLTPKQRNLVMAVHFQGLTKAEYAQRIGANRSSVTKLMKRAMRQLKRHLVVAGISMD